MTVGDVASEQWGLVTTAQARALGVSAQDVARLANQGWLERMTHGVYRVSGAPPEPLDELRAAWLTLDPSRRAAERVRDASPAAVSHRSAASLYGLGDIDADVHEFTTEGRKQSRRADIRLHRGRLNPEEWTVVDGMPVTTVGRTIADLAGARIDGGHLASVVRDALTVKLVSDRKLSAALAPFAYRYGAPAGDGEALLARLVQESGVAEPLGRAVELSRAGELSTQVAKLLADTPEMARLQEQMASIQRIIGPALMSPALERSVGQISAAAAKNMAQSASTAKAVKGVQDAVASTNLVEMSRLAEKIRQMVDTPEFRRFMAQQRKAQQ
jgi:hypothetical protein